jgi:hypothetical protein
VVQIPISSLEKHLPPLYLDSYNTSLLFPPSRAPLLPPLTKALHGYPGTAYLGTLVLGSSSVPSHLLTAVLTMAFYLWSSAFSLPWVCDGLINLLFIKLPGGADLSRKETCLQATMCQALGTDLGKHVTPSRNLANAKSFLLLLPSQGP